MKGRPRHVQRPVRRTIHVPDEVLDEVEFFLFDPFRQTRQYGALSALISELLRAWLNDQRRRFPNVDQSAA